MKFDMYAVWMDPVFYLAAAAFLLSLFALVYSVRRYVELKNADDFESGDEAATPEEAAAPEAEPCCQDAPSAEPAPEPPAGANRAEFFVKGIYEGISALDARVRNIEGSLAKGRVNNDFTVKFLEDMLADMGTLDKDKIKARIEYLLSDLKK